MEQDRIIKANDLQRLDTFLYGNKRKQMVVWKKMPVKIQNEVKTLIVLPGCKQVILDPDENVNLLYRVSDLVPQQ